MIESGEMSVGIGNKYSEIYLLNNSGIIKVGLFLEKETNNREIIRTIFVEELE